jgi:hypothetical protein
MAHIPWQTSAPTHKALAAEAEPPQNSGVNGQVFVLMAMDKWPTRGSHPMAQDIGAQTAVERQHLAAASRAALRARPVGIRINRASSVRAPAILKEVAGGGAVPVFFAGRGPDGVAGAHLDDGAVGCDDQADAVVQCRGLA